MTPQELLQLQSRLFQLLEPAALGLGHELVAVELVTVNGRRTMRVSVDRPGGVAFGELSRLSHALSALLDVEDPVNGAYDLEVSSPGIDRPLQRPADFARFVGFRARIQLLPDHARRRYTGVLRGVDAGAVVLEMDGALHRLDLAAVQRAQLVLDLAEYEALAHALPPVPPPEGAPLPEDVDSGAGAPAQDPGGSP